MQYYALCSVYYVGRRLAQENVLKNEPVYDCGFYNAKCYSQKCLETPVLPIVVYGYIRILFNIHIVAQTSVNFSTTSLIAATIIKKKWSIFLYRSIDFREYRPIVWNPCIKTVKFGTFWKIVFCLYKTNWYNLKVVYVYTKNTITAVLILVERWEMKQRFFFALIL